VAELKRQRRESTENQRSGSVQPSTAGHPSVEQLVAEQGTGPITDVSVLHGDFWPEDESIEEFLEALHEWRGHVPTNPAA
jgi:hypothetical protein